MPGDLHHSAYPPERLAAERSLSITVCLPARDEAGTIGPLVAELLELVELGAIDQVLVVDDSTDATAQIARSLGAEVHAQAALRPEVGPVLGKGDAMWRALSVATGDVVCFVDADTDGAVGHFACGLAGPVACRGEADFVKGHYRRPFRVGNVQLAEGGGRVTELTARPLLEALYPELGFFAQPLAGEVAARRELLERLPFVTGYGVDVALLIDAWQEAGIEAMAQVDLDVRQNRHRPLSELRPMAAAVMRAVLVRAAAEGRVGALAPLDLERPPAGSLAATA